MRERSLNLAFYASRLFRLVLEGFRTAVYVMIDGAVSELLASFETLLLTRGAV
jgi:hypothetical protein